MDNEKKRTPQAKWDKEHYTTVSCRISRDQEEQLRRKLTEFGLTRYTFLRLCCEWAIAGRVDDYLREMRQTVVNEGKGDKELNGIVSGRSHPVDNLNREKGSNS